MTLHRFWWCFGVVLVLAALVVCLLPGNELPGAFELNDKISHLVGHSVLALYFTGLVPRRSWWKIFVFLLVFGSLIEYAQYAMHWGRDGDWRDQVANSLGALLGILAGWLGLARWPGWVASLLGPRGVRE